MACGCQKPGCDGSCKQDTCEQSLRCQISVGQGQDGINSISIGNKVFFINRDSNGSITALEGSLKI